MKRDNKSKIVKLLPDNLFIWYLIIFGLIIIFSSYTINWGEQQFTSLAKSFLEGKTYFTSQTPLSDATFYNGHYYWPLGPFPGVLLMPFVKMFGISMRQGYLQFALNIVNLILLYKIAKKITNSKKTSLWLSYGYIFASAYLGVALVAWSWQFAQVVATTLSLLALHVFFYARRDAPSGASRKWIIIGILVGCAIATRTSLIVTPLFYILCIATSGEKRNEKISYLALFCLPVLISIALLLQYNHVRFHSYFEQGYSQQLIKKDELIANRQLGLWSIRYFPSNIYYFLFKGPEAVFIKGTTWTKILTSPFIKSDPWGMSILFTSPLFLWCLKTRWREKYVRYSLVVVTLTAFILFGYYGIGWRQYGYRYALDFYPFLFVILCYSFQKKEIHTPLKVLITCSFLFNIYLIPFVFLQP